MNDTTHGGRGFLSATVFLLIVFSWVYADSQEKIRVSYSSTDTLNSLWTIAGDAGFYKKHGLDADVVHIGSSTTTISAIVAQDVQVGNAAGSGIANAAVRVQIQ